jgi:hypothetical protein
MVVCEYARVTSDKDGRIIYRCNLYKFLMGLDLDQYCSECCDYTVWSEEYSRGLQNASIV